MRPRLTLLQLLITLTLLALIAAFLIPWIQRTRTQSSFLACQNNLHQLGLSLTTYTHQNHGAFPIADTLDGPQLTLIQSLKSTNNLGNPQNFYCPAQLNPQYTYTENNFQSGIIGYYYYSAEHASSNPHLSKFLRTEVTWPRHINTTMDPSTWLMSDIWISAETTAHGGYRKGVNYLKRDGSVNFIGESPRQAFH
jgi:type II secretory pathway pseudopilin PulG